MTGQIADRLRMHVEHLAGAIGERHLWAADSLDRSADYIESVFRESMRNVRRLEYGVGGRAVYNVEATIIGSERPDEIVLVGAHYDTVPGSPGADDNASGVAGILELARVFQHLRPQRTLRLVAFVNEEPPFFRAASMGSLVYARTAREAGENIVGMLSLEMIGFFVEASESQRYPFPLQLLYPSSGNFIGFVANLRSAPLLQTCLTHFRRSTRFPAQGASAPGWLAGFGLSDHWPFWKMGYQAVMITDTAFFRNHHYHDASDTPDTLNFPAMEQILIGLRGILQALCRCD